MADSLNAGINASHAGLFIHIDDNIVLHEEGLSNLVQPFVSDSTVVSSSGTLRRTHKHLVRDGQLFDPKLPLRWTDQFSLIDTFRPPWVAPSMGTIAIFKKSAVIKQGGYRFGGSDSELQTRLRSALPSLHYSIRKVNEPFFLIQAEPLDPSRILDLSLYPSMGMRGWSALFATLFFEWLFPILETVGLLMVMEACFKGLAGAPLFASYLGFCIILRTTRAALEILLEAIVFRIYRHPITLVRLFLATAIQNLGYRQYQDWKQFFLMMNWVTRWTEPRPS